MHVHNQRAHGVRIYRRSSAMTARFVLEEDDYIASTADTQRNCTCSASLKTAGTRACSRNEKACSRFRVTPGAYTLPKAGKISYTCVHCKLTSTPCRIPVSSITSRRAAASAGSPHSKLPVTDCQNPGGRRRSSSKNSPPSVWITIKTDSGRRNCCKITRSWEAFARECAAL